MQNTLLNKYKILEEINSNSKIKTYLTRIEPIVKVIEPKDRKESCIIWGRLEQVKNEIFKIIEENGKIYIIMENKQELLKKIDELILSDKIEKEIKIDEKEAITKEEILKLFEMEKSMCKIKTEKVINDKIKEGTGTGFFCQLNNFPIKYCLFTNNHIKNNIEKGSTIKFKYLKLEKSDKK